MGAITQKNIAAGLGLSRMAVSLALRDSPRVSLATRARVQAEAERLGYRPDPALAALSRYRHAGKAGSYRETLAFVTKWRNPEGWKNQYVRRFFDGALEAATRMGYKLEPFDLGEYHLPPRATAVLVARGIRGLLLGPLEQPGTLRLDWTRFASVAVGPSIIGPAVDRVMHNYEDSIRLVLTELAARGYRRCALVLPPRVDRLTERRVANAFLAETQRTPEWSGGCLWFPPDESERTFCRWVRREKPDCVISLMNAHADWLRAAGWVLPAQMGYVNLHLKDEGPEGSGIDYGAMEIGALALDRVHSLLQRHALGLPERPVLLLSPGRWREGRLVRSRCC